MRKGRKKKRRRKEEGGGGVDVGVTVTHFFKRASSAEV